MYRATDKQAICLVSITLITITAFSVYTRYKTPVRERRGISGRHGTVSFYKRLITATDIVLYFLTTFIFLAVCSRCR